MRIKWIDFSKGITILLVLIGHVILGLVESGQFLNYNNGMRWILEFLYAFHMPMFFALSGYFFKRIPTFVKLIELLRKKILTLGIPYLFFSIVMVVLQTIGGSAVRNENTFRDLLDIYKQPIGYLWFLYVLFFVFLYVGILSFLVEKSTHVMILLIMGYIMASAINIDSFIIQRVLVWSPLFYFGCILRENPPKIDNRLLLLIPVYILHVPIFRFFNPASNYLSQHNPGLWGIFYFIGIYIGFCFFSNVKYSEKLSMFEDIGEDSLVVYLVHVPVISVIRIVLLKFGISNILLHIIFGFFLSLFVCVVAIYLCKKSRLVRFVFYPTKIHN